MCRTVPGWCASAGSAWTTARKWISRRRTASACWKASRTELEKIWAEHADEIAARPEQKKFYQGIAGVHPESVDLVLSAIREKCGSAEAYLEAEYGLTPARLMRLRRMYLE